MVVTGGVNDMTIIFGLIAFFVFIGVVTPFINAELNTNLTEFNPEQFTGNVNTGDLEGVTAPVNAFKVLGSVLSMFFFTFGSIPTFIDVAIFIPLRLLLVLIISRNIWIGGGS